LLWLFIAGVACDEDCDQRCHSDYEDCVSDAHGDDAKKQRCGADRDQCLGICAAQPVDFQPPN
jgi:hypothetical protein